MAETTVTRSELVDAVYREVGLSRNESCDLLDAVLDEIVSALADGETVKIASFGNFSPRAKSARVGRNPKTGQAAPISPRTVAVFHASQMLKLRVKDGGRGR